MLFPSHSKEIGSRSLTRKLVPGAVLAAVLALAALARTKVGEVILETAGDVITRVSVDSEITTEEQARKVATEWMKRRVGLSDTDKDKSGIDPVKQLETNFDDAVRQELARMLRVEKMTPEQEDAVVEAVDSILKDPVRTQFQKKVIENFIDGNLPRDSNGQRTMATKGNYADILEYNLKDAYLLPKLREELGRVAKAAHADTVSQSK